MKTFILFATIFGAFMSLSGQISYGGKPLDWSNKNLAPEIPFIRTETIDREKLALEDAITDTYKDLPYRFGQEYEVDYSSDNSGIIQCDKKTGMTTWMLGIHCPDALAISIRFDSFKMPKGGTVFIWSADRSEFLGAFNHHNNNTSEVLAIGLVHGDQIVVEYSCPTSEAASGQLRIGQIVHAYRPFATSPFVQDALAQRDPFGSSGNCEVNINCPEGADWQIEKRAVAIITEGGFGLCSGALVNNTANDGTPYFLTANHCIQGGNPSGWVFYFNHESFDCLGSNGATSDLISGASVVAYNAGSDFALLLLNDTPPSSYNVQFAGWDASDSENGVQSAVCIHHPGGDVKKISIENEAPYHSTGNGADVWWVENWETGATEGGSSGSPLFNQEHRIIGQLFGGTSNCAGIVGNGLFDFFGRFGVSWNTGTTPSSRLKDWLDPGNTGALIIDGYPNSPVLAALDARADEITNVLELTCGSEVSPQFTLMNHGSATLTSCTIHYQLNGSAEQTIPWNGSLELYATATVNLPTFSVSSGTNNLTVWVSDPNGSDDQNPNNDQIVATFEAIPGSFNVDLSIQFDDYPDETSWEIVNANSTLYIGGPYTNMTGGGSINQNVCLPEGCYEFSIFDDYNDGICCSFGFGSYSLFNQVGSEIATGGTFGSVETTPFCISATAVKENSSQNTILFPNPAHDLFFIRSMNDIREVSIFDITGKKVMNQKNTDIIPSISTNAWPSGIYFVHVLTSEDQNSFRLIVEHE